MKRLAFAFSCAACLVAFNPSYSAEANWLELDEVSIVSANGRSVATTIVTVDSTRAQIRIVSIPFEQKSTPGSTDTSLRSFAQYLAQKHPRYRNRAWITVNGGYSSYNVDVPLGLLVVDGAVYSKLSKEKAKSSNGRQRYRWGGIFCEPRASDNWRIIGTGAYEPNDCRQALQAGPILVAAGKVTISPQEPKKTSPYLRTAVCLTADNRTRIVVTTQPIHLLPLAQWLSKSEVQGGLGCRVALNLSGDTSSGMAIRSSGIRELTYVGPGSFPLPTALIIEKRE